MGNTTSRTRTGVIAAAALALFTTASAADDGNQWTSAGGNPQNTRYQKSEQKLGVDNVAGLAVKWALTTGGDVSATPAVYDNTIYVPDWAGNLYAVER